MSRFGHPSDATDGRAPIPDRLSFKAMREAVQGCRACELYESATQAVMGTGPHPGKARLMLVGEQPGDREDIEGLARAERAGIPTFVRPVSAFETREGWDASLATVVERFRPDLVVSAGFMKLLSQEFLDRFLTLNTHPALCPAFPGMHGPRDALEHGVKVTGATLFVVDAGVDTGPIVAQVPVEVREDDDVDALHERIKTAERAMLVDAVGRIAREGISVEGRRVRIGAGAR